VLFEVHLATSDALGSMRSPESDTSVSNEPLTGNNFPVGRAEPEPDGIAARYYFDVLALNSTLASKKINGRKGLISRFAKIDRTQRNHR